MRLLAQPDILRSAGLASVVSGLLCFPRLQAAQRYEEMLIFAVLMLFWCQFVLWAFVFAWEPAYGKAEPLTIQRNPKHWALLMAGGVMVAGYQYFLVDPGYRAVAPNEYPYTFNAWWRQVLFTMAFSELFLCYAPLAFFVRLAQDEEWAMKLTVGFNVFFVAVKLFTMPQAPGAATIIALLILRLGIAYAAVRLYRWSGILAVSLLVLITQSRHLLRVEF
ncbi:MAG: hypothetical protein ACPGVU_16245 [Limisphaerales bacterium]